MPELEDIRGRTFQWVSLRGYPLDVRITDGGKDAGWLKISSTTEPEFTAEFAGVSWQVRLVQYGGYQALQISFVDGPIVGVTEKHIFAPLKVLIDGTRSYLLRHATPHTSQWMSEAGDVAVFFRRSDTPDDAPKSGEIVVSPDVLDLDAPLLLVLGLLLAVRAQLFGYDFESGPA